MEKKLKNTCILQSPICKYIPYIKSGIIVGIVLAVIVLKKNTLTLSDIFIVSLGVKFCI